MAVPRPSRLTALLASIREAGRLAWESVLAQPARSGLAIAGVVIGIVTVVLVASVLVGLRNSVAQLFRELGTDNIFAFHRNGDPYTPASDKDALRRPLKPEYAEAIARLDDKRAEATAADRRASSAELRARELDRDLQAARGDVKRLQDELDALKRARVGAPAPTAAAPTAPRTVKVDPRCQNPGDPLCPQISGGR
jgi:hypothetical protein